MNKTVYQKKIQDVIIKMTDNSFDRLHNELLPPKYIVFHEYTSHPLVYASFFTRKEAKAFYNSITEDVLNKIKKIRKQEKNKNAD